MDWVEYVNGVPYKINGKIIEYVNGQPFRAGNDTFEFVNGYPAKLGNHLLTLPSEDVEALSIGSSLTFQKKDKPWLRPE